MKKHFKIIIFCWLFLILFSSWVYFFYARHLIIAFLEGKSEPWFDSLLHFLYPRLLVERQRFDALFFLQKADQVFSRFILCQVLFMALYALFQSMESFRSFILNVLNTPTSQRNTAFHRKLFVLILLFSTADWIEVLGRMDYLRAFYHPIGLYQLWALPLPSLEILYLLYGIMVLGAVLVFFQIFPVLSSAISVLLFILLQGFMMCFYKMEHTFASFTYLSMWIPFLLYEAGRAKDSPYQSTFLPAIRLSIGLAYWMAGMEKLLQGGWAWFSADNFRNYALAAQAPWGIWLSEQETLCSILLVSVVIFELTFIVQVFLPKLKYFYIFAGICFHWSTFIFLGAGGWFSPWILCYFFLLDWDKKTN